MTKELILPAKYNIIEKLGEGNYSVVYKVVENGGRTLGLKIARNNCRECNELVAREYQILSQFRHPNIVSVYDYDVTRNGNAYFIFGYTPGKPINKVFKKFSKKFVRAIIQIIDALSALHNKGFIHSDLKPEHIIYDENRETTVLIDFGFAAMQSQIITPSGTFGYLAPEVIKGIGIDQRSDLYSLGIIIIEILTGKRYVDAELEAMNLPDEFKNILIRLVWEDMGLRPTLPEIYQTLNHYLAEKKAKPISYKLRLPNTGFVAPDFFNELFTKKGKALIIEGGVGSGKTRLLQEMKYRLLNQNKQVFFYISQEGINFINALENFIGKKVITKDKEEKFQIFEELTQHLIKFAKDRELIIMVDDLTEFTEYELALFRYIGYGIENKNILLIGTSTPNKEIEDMGFLTYTLEPFTTTEIENLLTKTFFSFDVEKAQDFIVWLHTNSGGNPLFIYEILKHIFEKGVLYYQKNRWQLNLEALEKINLPRQLEEILSQRIARLSKKGLSMLQYLTVARHPVESMVLYNIFGAAGNIELENIKYLNLLREGILNNKRVLYLSNQIIGDVVKKSLSQKEEKEIGRTLIESIEKIAPQDINYASILARLCRKLNIKEKAKKYIGLAATSAQDIYDYNSALEYYKLLLNYKGINRAEILIKIADINQIMGNNETAVEYYKKALPYRKSRYSIYAGLGRAYSSAGNYEKAVQFLNRALRLSKNLNSDEYLRIATRLAYSMMNLRQTKEARQILKSLLKLARDSDNPEMVAEVIYYQASLEWYENKFDQAVQLANEVLELTRRHKLSKQYAYTANLLGSLYQQKGNIEEAQRYLAQAVEEFQRTRLYNAFLNSLENQANLHLIVGNYDAAKMVYSNFLTLAKQLNNKTKFIRGLINLGGINDHLSRFDEAIGFLKQALKIYPNDPYVLTNLASICYKTGDIEKGKSIIEDIEKKAQDNFPYLLTQVLLYAEINQEEKALKSLNRALKFTSTLEHIYLKIETYLVAAKYFYKKSNFRESLKYAKEVIKIAYPLNREYSIADIYLRLNRFHLSISKELDIDEPLNRLKEIGCLYDYAYLKRLKLEILIRRTLKPDQLAQIGKEIIEIKNIFSNIGARLELNHTRRLQEQLFLTLLREYSEKAISSVYLKTLTRIAELINAHLGKAGFVQHILDTIIHCTNAERGALFIKTAKGIELAAGQNIDQTTIKDANELSLTAIRELEKKKIIFTYDALSDPDFNVKKSVILNKIRSLMCIPLSISGNIIGAIYLDSRLKSGIFGPRDKEFLLTIAKILSSVIEKSFIFQRITEENILLKNRIIEEIGKGYIIGNSSSMKRVYRMIEDVAQTNSPVLITGETGTGKSLIARLIHHKSNRRDKNFLVINCGTIPETLLESELFGHKKGAFTGAVSDKMGLLEAGESGTVFLDEITNTNLSFQAKLLEAIDDKIIRRLGETKTRKIDVRFLFATNKDLDIEVEEGRFRKDLFYRINVFRIEIPPLRERTKDIPLLAQHFLNRYKKEMNKNIDGFTADAIKALTEYYWPGNVRELQNVIERAVVLSKGRLITSKDLGFNRLGAEVIPLNELKKDSIIEALNATNGNVKKAAELLGISRRTLHRYIKKYNIQR